MLEACPLCTRPLELRKVAPCHDCGHEAEELEHLARGDHEYHVYTVFGQQLVLCDFCCDDFDSYRPDYFGAPTQDYEMVRGRRVAPKAELDGVCDACQHRVAFLKFLVAARAYHADSDQERKPRL